MKYRKPGSKEVLSIREILEEEFRKAWEFLVEKTPVEEDKE